MIALLQEANLLNFDTLYSAVYTRSVQILPA